MIDTKNLKILHISHNNLTDKGIGMLAEGIAANVGIDEIQFTHNDLSRANGIKFMESLANLPNLKKLCLNSCNLHVPCLESLKAALDRNTELQELNLYSNEIDAEGAQIIAQTLVGKEKLRILGLSNNIIGQGGARELA